MPRQLFRQLWAAVRPGAVADARRAEQPSPQDVRGELAARDGRAPASKTQNGFDWGLTASIFASRALAMQYCAVDDCCLLLARFEQPA